MNSIKIIEFSKEHQIKGRRFKGNRSEGLKENLFKTPSAVETLACVSSETKQLSQLESITKSSIKSNQVELEHGTSDICAPPVDAFVASHLYILLIRSMSLFENSIR